MKTLYVGIPDKLLAEWIEGQDYIKPADEGEAIGIAGGWWLATGQRATVFMSADGFMNALNAITSWVIPEKIEMDLVISIGRTEPAHYIATEITEPILNLLEKYDTKGISVEFVRKQ